MMGTNLISTILFMLVPVIGGSVAVFAGFHFAKRKEAQLAHRKPQQMYNNASAETQVQDATKPAREAEIGETRIVADIKGISSTLDSILASMEEARRVSVQLGGNTGLSNPVFTGMKPYWLSTSPDEGDNTKRFTMTTIGTESHFTQPKSVMLLDPGTLMQGIKQTVSEGVRVGMRQKAHRPSRHHAKT